jgi:prepilin-type N-terminal cleavage/methylation domain-containing protein
MSSRGVTLIELLLALVLVAITAGIATPRLINVIDLATVHAETASLVSALDAARGAALRLGTVTRLTLADSGYQVAASVSGEPITPWRSAGPSRRGVRLTGAGQPILFAPSGIAMGAANRTLWLSKGAVSRRVVLSRLGRLTW